jgi:hypothetical protein
MYKKFVKRLQHSQVLWMWRSLVVSAPACRKVDSRFDSRPPMFEYVPNIFSHVNLFAYYINSFWILENVSSVAALPEWTGGHSPCACILPQSLNYILPRLSEKTILLGQ